MDLTIIPADIIKTKIRVRKNGKGKIGEITIPPDIIKRYNLENKEIIHIAYLCKGTEDIKQPKKT